MFLEHDRGGVDGQHHSGVPLESYVHIAQAIEKVVSEHEVSPGGVYGQNGGGTTHPNKKIGLLRSRYLRTVGADIKIRHHLNTAAKIYS